MGNTLSTALSGMQAAHTRLDSAAHNVANAQTPGYQSQRVALSAESGGGVTAQVEKIPQAGVDLTTEMVEQKSAAYAWKANLQMLKTADTQVGTLLSVRA